MQVVTKEVPVEVEKIVFKEVPGICSFLSPTAFPPRFSLFGSVRKCHELTYAWLDALMLSVCNNSRGGKDSVQRS